MAVQLRAWGGSYHYSLACLSTCLLAFFLSFFLACLLACLLLSVRGKETEEEDPSRRMRSNGVMKRKDAMLPVPVSVPVSVLVLVLVLQLHNREISHDE
ncbi:hypothetical protein M0802_015282 [Mischocyttarus mexicanus]|nr:hypothetical protein M0802_015282 [Mischocyttarus mexicanus]